MNTDIKRSLIRYENHGVSLIREILDCGGKRSATPLWKRPDGLVDFAKSAVAAALCQRSPKAVARNYDRFPKVTAFENTSCD
jgi:hypothetical protein